MRKMFSKKLLSMLLAASMVVGSTAVMTGCGSSADKGPITLTVYSQLANYSGEQTGWSADVLLDKFNVKLNIIPESSGTFQTRMESKDLGDIVIWANDTDQYSQAVKAGYLFDWEEDDILHEYGSYIEENMPYALEKNRNLTATITNDPNNKTLYGFGHGTALSSQDHDSFFYTWDIRWDLYKKLGYPKVKNLEDFKKLLIDMQKIAGKDDAGNKVYAASLWPDWDDAMVMYVKATATAYYGYDELGVGLYNPTTGEYYDALEENGPYLEMLKFYNDLYQEGLIDPDSMTQTYEQMIEKVKNGGTLFSIFNYSGQLAYNTADHTSAGKLMYCMAPEEASPIVYGQNPQGGNRIWSIGANTEYPDLCMEIINYMSTPEGRLTMEYGPEGECWNYTENSKGEKIHEFTELGLACRKKVDTPMGNNHKGTFKDGQLQINNITWSLDATDPNTTKETYNCENWESYKEDAGSKIMQDWRDKNNAIGLNDYMENRNYTVAPGSSYTASSKSDELKTTWQQVTDTIKTDSWKAIYAKSDSAFDSIVKDMIKTTAGYGYDDCVKWSEKEAATRFKLQQELQDNPQGESK